MSRIKLISVDGSYLRNSFISKGLKWTICGTESNGDLMDSYDTFKSEKGTFQTVMRKQIKKLQDDKLIEPID